MKIICENCGHKFHAEEDDYFCPMCGYENYIDLELEEGEEDLFDFAMETFVIQEMQKQIKKLGHEYCWKFIEDIKNVPMRISYRKIFFKAGGKMPEREEIK